MLNLPKPTTTLNNTVRPNQGETWASIASTWATEPRTWLAVSQLLSNFAKPAGVGGTIDVGIKYMGHIMVYNDNISIASNTINNLPKPS